MKKRNHLIIVFILMVTAAGCSETLTLSPFADSDTDSILGVISRIETREFGKRILVEENVNVHEPLEEGGKKTWYGISDKTELFKQNGKNSLLVISEDDLKKGQIAKAWSTGIHMTSYPSQTGAKRIIVF